MTHPVQRVAGALRTWSLLTLPLIGMGAGLTYSLVQRPVYTADAYTVVSGVRQGAPTQEADFAQAFARVTVHPGLLAGAGGDAYLSDGELLRTTLQASASPDAPLIRLAAVADTADEAARRANSVAGALTAYANRHSADTGVRLAGFAPAVPPAAPSSPRPLVAAAVSTAGGLLLAALIWMAVPAGPRRDDRETASPRRPVETTPA
ncbi:hypothetical protein ACFFV7_21285 [Nonomuraea spiralis]|uniref:Lipopolysaccharide biosynthesis protein n=1 Tax=Nonomuraea spiralis TaxID=46182 RepID=A0ABV5IGS5_9ACTN|nr:lipopolysaccharide biosynthesis protein [Nonomuraea spiralis]GGS98025.1 hypothetical protein GCM10010176_047440 [Nonomuraea spiralis]